MSLGDKLVLTPDHIDVGEHKDWREEYHALVGKVGDLTRNTFNAAKEKPAEIEIVLQKENNDLLTDIQPPQYFFNEFIEYFAKNPVVDPYVMNEMGFTGLGEPSIRFYFDRKA